MRNVLTLSALALTASLTLASAQTTVTAVAPVPVPVQPVHLPSALAKLVQAGGSITLTDAQGKVVATVSADGTVKVTTGMALSNATSVSVKQGATTTSFPLAVRVNNSGQLFVTATNAEGRTQVIPLVAAVNRAAKGEDDNKADSKKAADQQDQGEQDDKKADGKKTADQQDQDEDDSEKQDGKKGGAPAGQHGEGHQPGHGNGHR